MENWEQDGMRGYTSENASLVEQRRIGSGRQYEIDHLPAKMIVTLGKNKLKDGSLAYIKELQITQRKCGDCGKFLADSWVNYSYKLRYGIPTRNHFDDELHNPPITACDIFHDAVEENFCFECSKYYSKSESG